MSNKEEIMPLSFKTLRLANITRLPLFKNRKGGPAHSEPDGSDWTNGDWVCAITGELGEAAGLVKQVTRGDFEMDEEYDPTWHPGVTARQALAKEMADVVTYLDILAMRCGVDLGAAVASKFNEVSRRVGAPVFIVGDEVSVPGVDRTVGDDEG